MEGKWVVVSGQPIFQWTFTSGWKQDVPLLDVCMQSTTQSNWEMFLAETVVKMQLVYDQLNVEKPAEDALIRQVEAHLMPWATGLNFLWANVSNWVQLTCTQCTPAVNSAYWPAIFLLFWHLFFQRATCDTLDSCMCSYMEARLYII